MSSTPNSALNSNTLKARVSGLNFKAQLSFALRRLLSQQGYPIDNALLSDVIDKQKELQSLSVLLNIVKELGIEQPPEILSEPDVVFLPLLAYHQENGWGIIYQQTPQGRWQFEQDNQTRSAVSKEFIVVARLRLNDDISVKRQSSFSSLLSENLKNYRGIFLEAVVASFIINFLALFVSLFSMQVYDRVIPTRNHNTLVILASGVALVIIIELFMKFARSRIMDKVVAELDQYLSREVFGRLLKVRIDQLPGSVGSMAAQLRGYEQVRSFYTASTMFSLVDMPMVIIFIVLVAYIGSPLVAMVPIIAAIVAIILGFNARKKIDKIAAEGARASYQKTGILVEAVEGIETIKSGSGSWKFLSRWLDVLSITVKNDLNMKHANDNLTYTVQMIQQLSYVGIVIVGSYVVMSGGMTLGGVIACSILGGRILAPIMATPNLIVQYSHAKAAKQNIEQLFSLKQDNHGVDYPLSPTRIHGDFYCSGLVFNYLGNDRPAVQIENLNIKAGEKIAILGAIGSGKSTLLKLLAGLYAPTQGKILLDGLDMQQISRESLSEQVGYLQQDHRLFQGTLRENLLIGMPTPSDDEIHGALKKTGLIHLVASHSSGLDLPISEGGKGLSGGQKQLVAFTRLVLTKPTVMLLDEPTASMDNRQEQKCLSVLKQELEEGQTLVVSTHKSALLDLVDRIIIMDNQQIIMDGPKETVLNHLIQHDPQRANKSVVKPVKVQTEQPQQIERQPEPATHQQLAQKQNHVNEALPKVQPKVQTTQPIQKKPLVPKVQIKPVIREQNVSNTKGDKPVPTPAKITKKPVIPSIQIRQRQQDGKNE